MTNDERARYILQRIEDNVEYIMRVIDLDIAPIIKYQEELQELIDGIEDDTLKALVLNTKDKDFYWTNTPSEDYE